MDQLVLLLPPAVIIGVILFTNNLTNKRIDDLRDQMKSDHDKLYKLVLETNRKLDEHITDYSIHNMKAD